MSVAEVAEQRREEHVADDEGRLQGSGLAIVDLVFLLDLPKNTWKEKLERKVGTFQPKEIEGSNPVTDPRICKNSLRLKSQQNIFLVS